VLGEGQQTKNQSADGEPVGENISSTGGMTRSGRIFTPPILRKDVVGNEGITTGEIKELLKEKDVQTQEGSKKEEKQEISYVEACEFLKFIQQSEYKVVEQFKRMPARISLLELLMHSISNRKMLMKILNKAHVDQNISLDKFEGIVGNITANNYLTFTDDEIPAEGRGHNKALHVSVKCLDHVIARILIDNGSLLNVMPRSTLEKLSCDGMHMEPSAMIVRAFDGSKREVMGEIELPVQIGPCIFQIIFQVMDIILAYSCLLGRPWIHSSGEEDLLVSGPSLSCYIEAVEEAFEITFQSLEIMVNAYVEPFSMVPHMSCASLMMAKVMLKEGYQYGKGLGKNNQGLTFPLEVFENKGRYGLGYKPTKEDKRRLLEEKKERILARVEGRERKIGKIHICDIKKSFRNAGWVNVRPTKFK